MNVGNLLCMYTFSSDSQIDNIPTIMNHVEEQVSMYDSEIKGLSAAVGGRVAKAMEQSCWYDDYGSYSLRNVIIFEEQ